MPLNEDSVNFLKYAFAETKDLTEHFLTVVTAVLVFFPGVFGEDCQFQRRSTCHTVVNRGRLVLYVSRDSFWRDRRLLCCLVGWICFSRISSRSILAGNAGRHQLASSRGRPFRLWPDWIDCRSSAICKSSLIGFLQADGRVVQFQ
jgi:hypothetical protein